MGSDYELRPIQDLRLEGVALENKTSCGLHSRTVFSFVIVALFILLHDHRISVFFG